MFGVPMLQRFWEFEMLISKKMRKAIVRGGRNE